MSPKHPIRTHAPGTSNEGPTGIRDKAPDYLPRRPVNTQSPEPGHAQAHQFPERAPLPDAPPSGIEVINLPIGIQIRRASTERSISDYYLAPKLVDRLPAPDPETGIRSISSGRQYVDLVDGGTVPLGNDSEGHYRAKQMTELEPAGPRLERVAGTPTWRRVDRNSVSMADSELIVSRVRQGDGQEEAGPSKRPRPMDSSSEPWKDWGLSPQHASPDDVTIDGVRYKTLPRSDTPNHPVVYIKNPAHLVYDFDLMQVTLKRDINQQPRGAIQIPPTHHWEIDPNLPFGGPFTDYVATYFPELTADSLLNVARKQFSLANGSDIATGAGLTTLRQVFNDWKTRGNTPRPELIDPLLMLPVVPMSPGKGTARVLELPVLSDQAPLQRLTFDPRKFYADWDYFANSTQYGGDIKRFMASLLTRNGYTVFEPTTAQSYPTLIFQRTEHDFVFYMSLHRVHGKKIHIPSTSDQGFAPHRLLELIGVPAMRAVASAEAANKLIWLKGGSHISTDRPDSVFIVRSEDPRR
ncbi:hypothetical protein ACYZT9_10285 [Pseudomonas sp. ZT5P21]